MSTKTTNLQLTKPAYGEAADIAVINTNMDTIDTAVAGKVTAPSSTVTTDTVAVFDGTTGKLIKSSGFTIGKSVPSNAVFTDNNTKNTAGTTNKTGTKLFLAGATGQSANPQTYSNSNVYIGTDNALYSNGKQVVNLSDSQALTNKTYNGYTLGPACAKDVDTAVTAGSSNLPTSGAVASAMAGISSPRDTFVTTDVTSSYYWTAGGAQIGYDIFGCNSGNYHDCVWAITFSNPSTSYQQTALLSFPANSTYAECILDAPHEQGVPYRIKVVIQALSDRVQMRRYAQRVTADGSTNWYEENNPGTLVITRIVRIL